MAPSATQLNDRGPYAPAYRSESATSATAPAFAVSQEEVLTKRAVLLAEADDFRLFLERIWDQLFMTPMGGDPVSEDVARAITDRIRDADDSYFTVCQQWVTNLDQAADALAETARQYGYTDEEIAESFNGCAQGA